MSLAQVQLIGGFYGVTAPAAGGIVPLRVDATGALIVTGAGAGGSTVVAGTKTVDLTHVSPSDALDTRSHLYARTLYPFAPYVRDLSAIAALRFPFTYTFDFLNAAPPNPPTSLFTTSLSLGFQNGTSYAADQYRYANYEVAVVLPSLADLYTVNGEAAGMIVESTMVASTGAALRRMAMDAANNGLIVNPRALDYDGVSRRPLVNGVGKAVALAGLPLNTDDEDAPTPYFSPGTAHAGVIKNGPGWLLALEFSGVNVAPP